MKRAEQDFHISVETMLCSIVDTSRCWWCHIPNEGMRSPAALAIACRMGLKPGAPDYVFVVRVIPDRDGALEPKQIARAFFIELKHGEGKPSGNQLDCQAKLNAIGAKVYNCWTVDDVIIALRLEHVPTRIVGGLASVAAKPKTGAQLEIERHGKTRRRTDNGRRDQGGEGRDGWKSGKAW